MITISKSHQFLFRLCITQGIVPYRQFITQIGAGDYWSLNCGRGKENVKFKKIGYIHVMLIKVAIRMQACMQDSNRTIKSSYSVTYLLYKGPVFIYKSEVNCK